MLNQSAVFFLKFLLPAINSYRNRIPGRRRVEWAAAKRSVLMPKYVRIFALKTMKQVLGDNDTYRFITSKFGELSVQGITWTSSRRLMPFTQNTPSTL